MLGESEVSMVTGRIVEGSAREIAEKITQMVGDRRVTVMLMENSPIAAAPPVSDEEFERIMAEIAKDAVSVPHVDDSREGIYTRQDGE